MLHAKPKFRGVVSGVCCGVHMWPWCSRLAHTRGHVVLHGTTWARSEIQYGRRAGQRVAVSGSPRSGVEDM